jgi:hypothetical protein
LAGWPRRVCTIAESEVVALQREDKLDRKPFEKP